MGAGKSSIGRQLARHLARPFWDSDRLLEQRTGVDISTIFEFEGESGFRLRESKVIDELTQHTGIVLATGGGAVLCEQNRRWLQARGSVIFLCATVDTQLKRAARNRKRPLLQTPDRRARLTSLWEQREPLYREIADLVISTDHYGISFVIKTVMEQLELGDAQRPT
jgi:shikimate kinase